MPEISKPDKLRLSNRPDGSKLSASKLTTRLEMSKPSKSRLNNFDTAATADLTKSELLKVSIRSDKLIEDKS